MPRGFITAIRTLSIIPIPGEDAEDPASSLSWFALVGGILGFILYGAALFMDWITRGSWPEGAAIVVVLGGIIITRGFHLDGIADWADAFINISEKKKTLEIMKDSHVGVFGVLMLIAILMTKWVVLTRLVVQGGLIWLGGAYIISRTVQVELAVRFSYARSEDGTGRYFVKNAKVSHRIWAWFSAFILILIFCGPAGIFALGLGWLISRLFGIWCDYRIGGVTGDLLGACSEITETLILFFGVLMEMQLARFTGWNILV